MYIFFFKQGTNRKSDSNVVLKNANKNCFKGYLLNIFINRIIYQYIKKV